MALLARSVALAVVLLSFATSAVAHGPPPLPTGLLGLSGQDATLVRLTRGLAQRVSTGFRFVCPEAWGGDIAAPAAAIPDGPALVASEQLFIVEPDGRVSQHPSQLGAGVALAANREALFGLFKRDGQHALWRISERSSDLVRTLDEPFGVLAASDNQIALLRWTHHALVLQTMSLTGELREPVTWYEPSAVAHAELRVAAQQLYVVIWGSSKPWVTLGRITERGYEPLREANVDIVGPLVLDGETVVALDGSLDVLEEGSVFDAGDGYVTCLGSEGGQPYACSHGDVLRVGPSGLGDPLFELASLEEPDYDALPAEARPDCLTRWLDLREHVAGPSESSAAADAGAPDNVAPDAGELTPGEAMATGCVLSTGSAHGWYLHVIVLALLTARRSRHTRRRG